MKFVILLLLLPLAWVVVLMVRWFLGSGFKARDVEAKHEGEGLGRWQAEHELARQRMENDKKTLAYQDELDEHAQRNEQVYPIHESKTEHLKKQFHVGQEKETTYPETRRPGRETKNPEKPEK